VNIMKNLTTLLAVLCLALLSACTRVAPNFEGVLMQNYGKNGKSDFSITKGSVNDLWPGTELFQVPLWDQRADFGDRILNMKAADNTAFTSKPLYTYRVISARAVDVVFDNKHLGSSDKFMRSLEDNILEPKIYDLMKEASRRYTTDELMANGGSLKYEEAVQETVKKEFAVRGLELLTFSGQLDFSDKVKAKIDSRNEVNTNLSVLDQQVAEQVKRNELAKLKAEENKILSTGITPQLLQQQFIEKWDGKTPLYGNMPITLLKQEAK
jgi:hypothetical protein